MRRSTTQHRLHRKHPPAGLLPVSLLLAALLSALLLPAPLAAASSPALEFGPALTARMLDDGADGVWSETTLFEAALIAGGVENKADLFRFSAELQRHRENLAARLTPRPQREHVSIVWRYLRSHLLSGSYLAEQTRIDATLESGDFNCLSACVLFTGLCREFSVSVVPCVVRGHIFCRLCTANSFASHNRPLLANGLIVELTADIESHAFLDLRAMGDSGAIYRQPARRLSDTQLIAKIFYNRAASLSAEKQFARAANQYEASLRLDPEDAAAQENRLANLCRWALDLSDQERFSEAEQVLRRAWRRNTAYPPLLANSLHIDQKRISQLYRTGRIEDALRVIHLGASRQPHASFYSKAKAIIEESVENRLESSLNRGGYEAPTFRNDPLKSRKNHK